MHIRCNRRSHAGLEGLKTIESASVPRLSPYKNFKDPTAIILGDPEAASRDEGISRAKVYNKNGRAPSPPVGGGGHFRSMFTGHMTKYTPCLGQIHNILHPDRDKQAKNQTLFSSTSPSKPYKGVPPPPGCPVLVVNPRKQKSCHPD